jgi:hypothetical protein
MNDDERTFIDSFSSELPRNKIDNLHHVGLVLLLIVRVVVSLQFQELPPLFRIIFLQHETAQRQQTAVHGVRRDKIHDGDLL